MPELQPGFPDTDEYPTVLTGYVISTRAVVEPVRGLEDQRAEFVEFCRGLDPALRLYRYETGKWSVQQMLGHIVDTERTFAYRALRISRGDAAPNLPFDQEDYASAAQHETAPWEGLVDEFDAVRRSTVLLFRHLPPGVWLRTGAVAGGVASVRALAHATIGHLEHHRSILRDRYLGGN